MSKMFTEKEVKEALDATEAFMTANIKKSGYTLSEAIKGTLESVRISLGIKGDDHGE